LVGHGKVGRGIYTTTKKNRKKEKTIAGRGREGLGRFMKAMNWGTSQKAKRGGPMSVYKKKKLKKRRESTKGERGGRIKTKKKKKKNLKKIDAPRQ